MPEGTTLIIGHNRAGKTTAAHVMANLMDVRCAATAEVIYDNMVKEMHCMSLKAYGDFYKSPELRAAMFAYGRQVCKDDPAALVRMCLEKAPIVDGVRSRDEFEIAKELFEHIIWIESPRGEPSDHTQVTIEDATYVIVNDGTMSQFMDKIMLCTRELFNV